MNAWLIAWFLIFRIPFAIFLVAVVSYHLGMIRMYKNIEYWGWFKYPSNNRLKNICDATLRGKCFNKIKFKDIKKII
jgi:succinate dehydrogenase hydrophobic anchor subunit